MTGPRSPYDGTLGVIEKGAFVADPERYFRMVMTGGRIHKNAL